ncbi:hypothetical protein LOK49_LG02G00029 [Camellia lanceoleosa]|uniref:Uncharacterized protein n=1 Tax=Camellia lanceoleosa TaxID=1840588 RepID=A0ACC0ILS3_9ERIC|nr:hypothetical protein LOK49_LG02G00029 [Camellia lanceoleosa]
MDFTHGMNMDANCQQDEYTSLMVNTIVTPDSTNVCEEEVNASYYKPYPLEILDHLKINNTLESPISTIKGVLKDSTEKDLSFNKEELRKVEGPVKGKTSGPSEKSNSSAFMGFRTAALFGEKGSSQAQADDCQSRKRLAVVNSVEEATNGKPRKMTRSVATDIGNKQAMGNQCSMNKWF